MISKIFVKRIKSINFFLGYWQEGFLTLQKAIDVAVEQYLTNTTANDLTLMVLPH